MVPSHTLSPIMNIALAKIPIKSNAKIKTHKGNASGCILIPGICGISHQYPFNTALIFGRFYP